MMSIVRNARGFFKIEEKPMGARQTVKKNLPELEIMRITKSDPKISEIQDTSGSRTQVQPINLKSKEKVPPIVPTRTTSRSILGSTELTKVVNIVGPKHTNTKEKPPVPQRQGSKISYDPKIHTPKHP